MIWVTKLEGLKNSLLIVRYVAWLQFWQVKVQFLDESSFGCLEFRSYCWIPFYKWINCDGNLGIFQQSKNMSCLQKAVWWQSKVLISRIKDGRQHWRHCQELASRSSLAESLQTHLWCHSRLCHLHSGMPYMSPPCHFLQYSLITKFCI